jgi:UDP-N-acetylglucosamine 1-carboxyvinyltransferase
VDIHLSALEHLGAEITLDEGYVEARAPGGLKGAEIRFPFPSVGATENILMAATLASGVTVIDNAACEPEITDLVKCLVTMGAEIEGIGTSRLTVHGQTRMHGGHHTVVADRIEAGSFAMAAPITGGELELIGAVADDMGAMIDALETAGVKIEKTERGLKVSRKNGRLNGIDLTTQPHPGFPTDLQAQMMALLTMADGASTINETIFENRFMHVPELARMGADITLHGNTATVRGVERLKAAPVMATDLRASISLVLAALAAEGESVINRVYHLDRGYERVEEKLSRVGADIRRLKE